MSSDRNLEVVSEVLQGVSVVHSTFGTIYFKHLSQGEQREILSKSKIIEDEAKKKGLKKEEDCLTELGEQGMWIEEEEEKLDELRKKAESLKTVIGQLYLPSKRKAVEEELLEVNAEILKMESERAEILGLTLEKYVNSQMQKLIIEGISFYDRDFTRPVFKELYANDGFREVEIYKLQKDFFQKFSDDNISKSVLSDHFSLYLPFCEDVLGVFGKPLRDLTTYQLKLISYARYFLNIFKNCQKKIPDNIAKDPELLISFYESSKDSENRKGASMADEGGSTHFGASKEDIEAIKREDENAIELSEEIKKRGGSLNMQQMMELHGL